MAQRMAQQPPQVVRTPASLLLIVPCIYALYVHALPPLTLRLPSACPPQLICVSSTAIGATIKHSDPAWTTIKDVTELVDLLLAPSRLRSRGVHLAQPTLVRAGPGTGKTWMVKQAAYMLAKRLAATEHTGCGLGAANLLAYLLSRAVAYLAGAGHEQVTYLLASTYPLTHSRTYLGCAWCRWWSTSSGSFGSFASKETRLRSSASSSYEHMHIYTSVHTHAHNACTCTHEETRLRSSASSSRTRRTLLQSPP